MHGGRGRTSWFAARDGSSNWRRWAYWARCAGGFGGLFRCRAPVRVNTVSPGPIVTGIFGKGAGETPDEADATTEDARAAIAAILPRWQPLPYVGCAGDIA